EALGDQIAAYREKHELAGEAENRLAAGQDHQRVVILRVLGQQKGMRENDGERRHQPQQVEIVVPLQLPLSGGPCDNARGGSLIHGSERAVCCGACRAAPNRTIRRSCEGGPVQCGWLPCYVSCCWPDATSIRRARRVSRSAGRTSRCTSPTPTRW